MPTASDRKPRLPGAARAFLFGALAAIGLGTAALPASAQTMLAGLNPAEIADAAIKPGLRAYYVYGDFKHVDKMPDLDTARQKGTKGQPVPQLNHRSVTGAMLESGVNENYGIVLEGFIRFGQAGSYALAVRSNDGMRIQIAGQTLVDDPEVHSDRFSIPGMIEISKPGWYPLAVFYFQRKMTAAMELHWQPPGAANFAVVPADAYAHRPDAN